MNGKTLDDLFYAIICLNEGGESVALRFSDPDGVRSGKSGWSFGVCQFDVKNNAASHYCLRACGFTEAEIEGLVNQTINVEPLNIKLAAHGDTVRKWSEQQLHHCLEAATKFANDNGIPLADTAALLMLADTVNQYGILGPGTKHYLACLNRPVTAQDVLTLKLAWKYARGSKRGYNDTVRRYNNVMKIATSEGTNV